jgi:hypothetical protein
MTQAQSLQTMMQGAFVPVDAVNGVYAMQVSGATAGSQGVPIETSIPVAARVTSITDTATAPVTTPGVGAAISTTTSLPAGTYEVVVNSMITGTPADADVPNMRLLIGATPITRILNPGGAVISTAKVKLDTAGGILSVVAVAAGTSGAKYWAQIIATRIN